MTIRIVIADDHRIVREGLRGLLEAQPDMAVVAEAGDGRSALRLVLEHSPSVVVMDVSMPDLNGIEATRQIVGRVPGVRVLALSMHCDGRFVAGMLGAGAAGYLPKDCATEELVAAIRTVVANQIYLSPAMAQIVVKDYVASLGRDPATALSVLTPREREVLQLIAEGTTVKEIAAKLYLGAKTVETHRQHLMEKLGVRSIADLTKYAIREGLTSVETPRAAAD